MARSWLPQIPLGVRWALSVLFFVCLALAAYLFLHEANKGTTVTDANPAAEVQANRLGQIVVAQDQLAHHARLPLGANPAPALAAAIAADVRGLVAGREIQGPAGAVTCQTAGPQRRGRRPYDCRAQAGGLSYPFNGVVDVRAGTLTWCKNDAVDEPGLNVPLSPACLS